MFMLSSCDQILDAIYHPSNQIKVEVAVDTTTHPDFNLGYVHLQLSGPGVSAWEKATWSGSESGGYAYYDFTFTKLPDGTFNFAATYFGRLSPIANGHANDITMPDINSSNPDSTGRSVTITIDIP
jgi:hypothetical protein